MKQLFAFSAITLGLLLASCSEKAEDSYAPVYGRMTFSPSVAHVGDSVVATVPQTSKGHGLAGTDYNWAISYSYLDEQQGIRDTTLRIPIHTNYDALDSSNPSVKFLVPQNCASRSVSVSLSASFDAYIGYTPFLKLEKSGQLTVRE